jgi:hypothetical protein
MARRRAARWFGSLLIALLALQLTGCVERTISITSEPAGALVHLNDVEVGRTPVTVPFTFYGVYDVRLEAEGHRTLWTTKKAEAPWWETPGVDLVAEAVPDARSDLAWHFDLEATPTVDEARLIDHARQLRATVEQAEPPSP